MQVKTKSYVNSEEIVGNRGYWSIEKDVSRGFNRLKAKFFNLIEATITDTSQQEAKGLIRVSQMMNTRFASKILLPVL